MDATCTLFSYKFESMLLLALAIAPGLAICVYVLYHDVYNREPAINMIMSFFWGMLSILPAVYIEGPFSVNPLFPF